jgi:protein-S-isoprenylcysteine O-methyltransferase Ste14
MELYCRMSVWIIYFFQMAALIYSYKKTNDKKILYDPARETRLLFIVRVLWVYAIIAAILLYILIPDSLKWGELHLSNTLRIFGIVTGIASDLLVVWILVSLGKNISAALKIRENQRLVTEGPYRYVRHPLYSAGIPLFFSIALISANWFLGLIGIGFQLFVMLVRTPMEEKMLLEHFGEEYRSYMKKTGAYFPRIMASR